MPPPPTTSPFFREYSLSSVFSAIVKPLSRSGLTPPPLASQDSFRTIIIGPSGSGKTVLAAVLADFVNANPRLGLQFRANDFDTKNYCEEVMTTLRAGDWPESTRQGSFQTLSWQWGVLDEWYRVDVIDPAGQDVTEEFTGKSARVGLANEVSQSNLVIMAVDVTSHQSAPPEQRRQNVWIVEHVLKGFNPERMNLLVVLTKADELPHLLNESEFGNREAVLNVLRQMMPECNLGAYARELAHANCSALAVAAIKAESVAVGGEFLRVPMTPLASMGLPNLVGKIVEAIRAAKARMDAARRIVVSKVEDAERRRRTIQIAKFAAIGSVALLIGGWIIFGDEKCRTCAGSGRTQAGYTAQSCTNLKCKSGKVPGLLWGWNNCGVCGGDAMVTVFQPSHTCPSCDGKGYVKR